MSEYSETKNVTDGQKVTKADEPLAELPGHVAPKMHQNYDEKPQVQIINEQLTDETPTGYKPHIEVPFEETPVEKQTHPDAHVENVPSKPEEDVQPETNTESID